MTKGKATGMKAADARSRLSTEKKAVVQFIAKLRKRLDESEGLWRYWTTHDITANDEEWAAFSNAVRDHLEGRPVPARFVVKPRVKI
jgi:hypothetical protein